MSIYPAECMEFVDLTDDVRVAYEKEVTCKETTSFSQYAKSCGYEQDPVTDAYGYFGAGTGMYTMAVHDGSQA